MDGINQSMKFLVMLGLLIGFLILQVLGFGLPFDFNLNPERNTPTNTIDLPANQPWPQQAPPEQTLVNLVGYNQGWPEPLPQQYINAVDGTFCPDLTRELEQLEADRQVLASAQAQFQEEQYKLEQAKKALADDRAAFNEAQIILAIETSNLANEQKVSQIVADQLQDLARRLEERAADLNAREAGLQAREAVLQQAEKDLQLIQYVNFAIIAVELILLAVFIMAAFKTLSAGTNKK